MPFYGVIRAIPHKALGIAVMAVLIVCLFGVVRGVQSVGSVGGMSGVGGVGGVGGALGRGVVSSGVDSVGDAGAVVGMFSGSALVLGGAVRTSVWLWVLDMCCLSVICLEVNHAESL